MAAINQIAQLIAGIGNTNTIMVTGQPGIGKSSLLPLVSKLKAGDYQGIYADCPLMDLPDMAMPYVVDGTTQFAPSSLWGFTDPRPKIIMLDEVSKAPNVVKPMFTRLMLERCIGEYKLPEGSIVFATGNNASDGVGDSMQGHINNRVTRVQMDNPSSEAWIEWAINNGVNEMVLAAVHRFPHVMQSYLDDKNGENPYIFNPKKNTGAFASPRSLQKAGFILDSRLAFGPELTHEALQGTVGVSFAGDLMAFLEVADTVPTWEAVTTAPKTTAVPKSPAARLLMLFGSVGLVDKDNAAAFTEYFFKFELEERMLWARQFKTRLEAVMGVAEFRKVLVAEHWVFN